MMQVIIFNLKLISVLGYDTVNGASYYFQSTGFLDLAYFRSREIALFLTESIPQFSFSAILAPVLPDSALGQDYTLE